MASGDVGAVYTMSNGLTRNEVIVFRLSGDGQLTWDRAVNTNGIGGYATPTNPFFSQGSMVVYSNYLFVVNAGSNSLSMFLINPLDATDLKLISVQTTFGAFPISVAVNSMYACVLTGGSLTGIRCFTYNSLGLSLVPSFDRDLTSFISQSDPPASPPGTFSEILFSPDDLSLIISVKGFNTASKGYLLFFRLSADGSQLSLSPTRRTMSDGILLFSMTLVGRNGLLITDPASQGVHTLTYSSTTGAIANHFFTGLDPSLVDALCWSVYAPSIGNYYVIGAQPSAIVELNVDMTSKRTPVEIVRYYPISNSIGALDGTVVTLSGKDYLYVVGPKAQVIVGYRLDAVGKATPIGSVAAQQRNVLGRTNIGGIAAFLPRNS